MASATKTTDSGTKSVGKLPKTKGDLSVDIPTGTGSKATGTAAGTGGRGLGGPTATGTRANGTIAGGVNGTLPFFTGLGGRGVSLFLNSVGLGVVSIMLGVFFNF
jgi:hypothetical protein